MKIQFIFTVTLVLGMFYNSLAQDFTGDQLIKKVNDLMNQKTVFSKSKMTIVTSSGRTRTFEYDSWSKDQGEKNLIRYTAPSRVKGQATLMLNHADDIWVYFARTKRTRKLATHAKKQKMQGSDFSYEDMGSGDAWLDDFTAKRLEDEEKEGHDCYKLELTRKKDADSQYSRLLMWVIKDKFVPIAVDYFDEDDPSRLIKSLVQYNIQNIDGIPTGMKMIMYNRLDNTQTSMELLEVKYNLPIDDKMFTTRELSR